MNTLNFKINQTLTLNLYAMRRYDYYAKIEYKQDLNVKKKFNYVNHVKLWQNHKKITLHNSTYKLLLNPVHYGTLVYAFLILTTISPQPIRAKQNVASFKLIKGSLIGLINTLRKHQQLQFSYKYCFIAPSAEFAYNANREDYTIGLNNLFVFHELDVLDYTLFEPLTGLEICFSLSK